MTHPRKLGDRTLVAAFQAVQGAAHCQTDAVDQHRVYNLGLEDFFENGHALGPSS